MSTKTTNTNLTNNKSNAKLTKSTGTIAAPLALEPNTWGYAIPGKANFDSSYITNPSQTSKWAGVPPSTNPVTINSETTATTEAGTNLTIWYGARLDTNQPTGIYTNQLTYTAVPDLPAAPTMIRIEPASQFIGGEELITITGSNLGSVYNVYIDLNQDDTMQSNEVCNDLTITSSTSISCRAPMYLTPGKYSLYLLAQGGTIVNGNKPGETGFSYVKTIESACASGNDAGNFCQVDIDDNMAPIKYLGNNDDQYVTARWQYVKTPEDKTNPGNWYDYEQKQWANAVTLRNDRTAGSYNLTNNQLVRVNDSTGALTPLAAYKQFRDNQSVTYAQDLNTDDVLGFWAYIPRYQYQVQQFSGVSDSSKAKDFEIKFQKKDDYKLVPKADGDWATHPAFTLGSKELNGIWMSKFEMTGTDTAPTFKPNQASSSAKSIGQLFDMVKSVGVNNQVMTGGDNTEGLIQNSHHLATITARMPKNDDWGAAAYLSASKYGAGVNKVQINSQYYNSTTNYNTDADGSKTYGKTGCGPSNSGSTSTYSSGTRLSTTTASESPTACSTDNQHAYNQELGQLASTTNNPTGIYDMSGGTWEYVMSGYSSDNNTNYSTSYMTNKVNKPYFNPYNFSSMSGCTWSICGGQAINETAGWGGDDTYFMDSSSIWAQRGGSSYDGSSSGVFSLSSHSGSSYNYIGTRAVLHAMP